MTLCQLKKGETATIESINGKPSFKKRLFELGFMKDTVLSVSFIAPFNGPIVVELRGYKLSLRISDAKKIVINKTEPVLI